MKILALDTTAKAVSVAVVDFIYDDNTNYNILGEFNLNAGSPHSRTLLPLIQNMLTALSMKPQDFDAFAVTTGPGSFTGVRIGVSAVKGICDASGIPCIGVSSLLSLAYNLDIFHKKIRLLPCTEQFPKRSIICPVMDARCSQVYNAVFKTENGVLTRCCYDRAVTILELKDELLTFDDEIILVGDGAELVYNELYDSFNGKLTIAPPNLRLAKAVSVARAAKSNGEIVQGEDLLPYYLRKPQAERN